VRQQKIAGASFLNCQNINFSKDKFSDFGSRSVFVRFWWFLHQNISQLKPERLSFMFQNPIWSFSSRKRCRQCACNNTGLFCFILSNLSNQKKEEGLESSKDIYQ
jgi:hypothetical protein